MNMRLLMQTHNDFTLLLLFEGIVIENVTQLISIRYVEHVRSMFQVEYLYKKWFYARRI